MCSVSFVVSIHPYKWHILVRIFSSWRAYKCIMVLTNCVYAVSGCLVWTASSLDAVVVSDIPSHEAPSLLSVNPVRQEHSRDEVVLLQI